MDTAHHDLTRTRYGARAADYLASPVHAQGDDLDQIEALVTRLRPARVLDLGCGGGHVAYRVAPFCGRVTACDPTPQMLSVVAAAAAIRGFTNLITEPARAEHLPFDTASFDLVISRFSAHHWTDIEAGLREARRVLSPQGQALFIDTIAPDSPLLDTHVQTLELLRDTTHVRNYRAAEWHAVLAAAGLRVTAQTVRRLRLDFRSWIARTNPPDAHVAAILSLQRSASAEVRTHFGVESDGSWTLDAIALDVVG